MLQNIKTFLRNSTNTISSTTKVQKLVQICAIRWVDRHESVKYFFKFTFYRCRSFDRNFSMARQRGTSSRALQLLSTITQSEFCIVLLVLKNVFGYSFVLCKVKQKKSINFFAAVNIAHDIANELKCLREKNEYEFH